MIRSIILDEERLEKLEAVVSKICVEESNDGKPIDLDHIAERTRKLFKTSFEPSFVQEQLEDSFKFVNSNIVEVDENKEFEMIENFILHEQSSGRKRRQNARKTASNEEKRLDAEIAALKATRHRAQLQNTHDELQQKIMDTERAYLNRKMVFAKASQVATAECRLQFSRVRNFFQELLEARKDAALRQHKRSLNLQGVIHRIKGTDPRVVALDQQIAERLYRKKLGDLNETHMAQNLEEAVYLESMTELLDTVQTHKETAARELFELDVEHLKNQREANARRLDELEKFTASALLQMAKLVTKYTNDGAEDVEMENKNEEKIESTERRKEFYSSSQNKAMSVSQLYDQVLWSVATSDLSILSSTDTMYSCSELDGESDIPDVTLLPQQKPKHSKWGAGSQTGSTASTEGGDICKDLSPVGNMHISRLNKELRDKERKLLKEHEEDNKATRREHRRAKRLLKQKHQDILDKLLESSFIERGKLREQISRRMDLLAQRQEETTKELERVVEKDMIVMRDAIAVESKRLADAETKSFTMAQTLISAQVFHEVRNALSSVIAMSEITTELKEDEGISPRELVTSVDEMLDQIKEVVHYALSMLNNVLDVSKIKSGTFPIESKPFDLQDLVARATKMQLSKAGQINMSFVPPPGSCVAIGDCDIVMRVVTNLISNAVKYTSHGGVQPFIWPLEELGNIDPSDRSTVSEESITTCPLTDESHSYQCFNDSAMVKQMACPSIKSNCSDSFGGSSCQLSEKSVSDDQSGKKKTKLYAVGVADTGCGLSRDLLESARGGVSTSDSTERIAGVQNTGFGLHLAHLLTSALGSRLRLSNLDKCSHLLNPAIKDAMAKRQRALSREDSSLANSIPGPGTVLYFTLPMYENDEFAKKELQEATARSDKEMVNRALNEEKADGMTYKFCPIPAPDATSFHIIVADDVPMLRKGMVHTILSCFRNFDCPVTIHTACTAEDLLRAVASYHYDLIISDNQFNVDTAKTPRLTHEELLLNGRPCVFYDKKVTSHSSLRDVTQDYFKHERFTVEVGDGALSGFDALKRLVEEHKASSKARCPVLMLLSGHNVQVPPELGIIVAQKPLKQTDFLLQLEVFAVNLLNAGFLTWAESGSGRTDVRTLINEYGSCFFVGSDESDCVSQTYSDDF